MIDHRARSALVPDPPRAIPRWFIGRRMQGMLFVGVLFTVMGGALAVGLVVSLCVLGGSSLSMADWRLDRKHALATGVISNKELIRHVHVNGQHPWKVRFQFARSDGAPVEAAGYTYDRAMASKSAGDAIEVEYDPDRPARARPVGGYASAVPPWVLMLMAGAVGWEPVVGVLLLALVGRRARKERTLLTHGVGAEAEVVRVRRVSYITFGRQHPYDVHYRFSDHYGREMVGKDRTYHYGWAEGLQPGQKVGVVYDAYSPADNVLWLHGRDIQSGSGD